MFKLKAGNVFEKINNMDRKQAYTIGAVVAVLIVALLLIGSLMGTADDSSLNDFQARGYDLAAMPFINDEAEQLLLSSKYPDMQGDGSSLLFSQQEKEERQEADGEDEDGEDEEEFDEDGDDDESGSSAGASAGGRSGGGYGGRGGGAGRGKTEVGRLGGASMGRSGGSGMSGSYGAPRGDYSQYKTQNKGKEKPIEFKNEDARRALSQFAKGSRAAAGLRDGKLANAKRALQGGDILGSEAFAGNGVDLSKTNGLALDTNAPIGSNPDLSNLKDKVANEAKKAEDKQKEKNKEKSFGEKLLSALGDAVINSLANAAGDLLSMGWDATKGWVASWGAEGRAQKDINALMSMPAQSWDALSANQQAMFSNNEALYKQWCGVDLSAQGYGTWQEAAASIPGLQDSFNNYKSQRRKDDFHRYFNPEKYSQNKDYTIGSTTGDSGCKNGKRAQYGTDGKTITGYVAC